MYICREKQELDIPNAVIEHHEYGDDYFEIISEFDIGIAPCFGETIIHKGKIAMKHQEFMICAIPKVCSPVAISEFVEDGRDVLIAKGVKSWSSQLIKILEDKKLRTKIGENSRLVYQEHYTFESEFPKVKKALTNF